MGAAKKEEIPLTLVQLIVVLERTAAQTGLQVSKVMEIMQLLACQMAMVRAEAEFAASAKALQPPTSTDRGVQ